MIRLIRLKADSPNKFSILDGIGKLVGTLSYKNKVALEYYLNLDPNPETVSLILEGVLEDSAHVDGVYLKEDGSEKVRVEEVIQEFELYIKDKNLKAITVFVNKELLREYKISGYKELGYNANDDTYMMLKKI